MVEKKTKTATKTTAKKSLTVKEIASVAKISVEETLLGLGWLFKEGKIMGDGKKVLLA